MVPVQPAGLLHRAGASIHLAAPAPRRRLIDRLAGLTERHPAPALLAAAIPVMAVEAALGPAGWIWTAAILGFAGTVAARFMTARRAGRPGGSSERAPRWRRVAHYADNAVLPFYVLHEPVIVAAAWVIVRWPAPVLVKYLSVVATSFVLTLALYEGLVRRFQLARFLFGMKPTRQLGAVAPPTRPVTAVATVNSPAGE